MYQTRSSTSLLKVIALCLLVAACGFKPVYGKQEDSTAPKLASVVIKDIPNRDGQVLKYKLLDLLQPQGVGASPEYELIVKLDTDIAEMGIQEDLRVTRYDIIKNAKYQLISLENNKEVDSGSIRIKSSYNRTVSEFSTFVAQEDADEKASLELAQEIRSRLIYYFSK